VQPVRLLRRRSFLGSILLIQFVTEAVAASDAACRHSIRIPPGFVDGCELKHRAVTPLGYCPVVPYGSVAEFYHLIGGNLLQDPITRGPPANVESERICRGGDFVGQTDPGHDVAYPRGYEATDVLVKRHGTCRVGLETLGIHNNCLGPRYRPLGNLDDCLSGRAVAPGEHVDYRPFWRSSECSATPVRITEYGLKIDWNRKLPVKQMQCFVCAVGIPVSNWIAEPVCRCVRVARWCRWHLVSHADSVLYYRV
jgi:hypothetical protein